LKYEESMILEELLPGNLGDLGDKRTLLIRMFSEDIESTSK